MTFWAFELLGFGGKPVELYEFTDGVTTWRYTSQARAVTWGGHTWAGASIRRGDINNRHELAQDKLSVEFPCTHEFAGQLIGYPSEDVIYLTVRRGHLNDPDAEFVVIWKGAVAMAKGAGERIAVECSTAAAALRRAGLKRRYGKNCPYALYGDACGVNKDDFAVAGTVSAVSGNSLTVAAASGYDDGWFDGGMVEAGGYFRMVTAHIGSGITLLWPFRSMAVSDAVTLYPGCARTDQVCDSKFDNLPNSGAFRFIPDDNPVGGGSIV